MWKKKRHCKSALLSVTFSHSVWWLGMNNQRTALKETHRQLPLMRPGKSITNEPSWRETHYWGGDVEGGFTGDMDK